MISNIKYIELSGQDEERWNRLLVRSLNASYRASMRYEYSKELNNRDLTSFIFIKNGKDFAGVHYSIKKSIYDLIKIGDVLSGIIFTEKPDSDLLSYILDHFISWGKKNKVSYLRFSPWLPAFIGDNVTYYQELFNKIFYNNGFHEIKPGSNTYWINLELSEAELLKNMKRQTRYDIRQGIKSKIKIESIDSPDKNVINQFWKLYNALGEKKRFNILTEKIFKSQVYYLLKNGFASLFVAFYENEIINMAMTSKIGIASYMYGAINPDFKRIEGCPAPGHLTQWEMMVHMKNIGLKTYDLGFCPGPIPVNEHPEYKIWRFKYGFGGKHVQYLPTYGKILHPVIGRLFQCWKY